MPRGSSSSISFGVLLAFAAFLGICFAVQTWRIDARSDRLRILEQLHRVERAAPTPVHLTGAIARSVP